MKGSIALGALAGIALGAIATFAIAHGVFEPVADEAVSPAGAATDRSGVESIDDERRTEATIAPAAVARPLRPGSARVGSNGVAPGPTQS